MTVAAGLEFLRFGAATPVGRSWITSCAAVRANVSRLGEHPFMFDGGGKPVLGAWASYLPDTLSHEERLAALVSSAVREVLDGLALPAKPSVGLVLSLPTERPAQRSDLAAEMIACVQAASAHAIAEFPEVRSVAVGNAGGLNAVAVAAELMRSTDIALCLLGGLDSLFDPTALDWLDGQGRLHGPSGPWGLLPGEAAAFALVGCRGTGKRLQLPVLGRVVGLGLGTEVITIHEQGVCLGRGLTTAWKEALQPLASGDRKIDDIYLDRNAEPYRADEHGFSLVRLRERFVDPSVFWTPINSWGDTGAAVGVLLTQLAVAAGQRGYASGNLAFVSTSSDSGQRAALALELVSGRGGR